MPAKWKKWNIIAGKGKVMGKEKKKEFEKRLAEALKQKGCIVYMENECSFKKGYSRLDMVILEGDSVIPTECKTPAEVHELWEMAKFDYCLLKERPNALYASQYFPKIDAMVKAVIVKQPVGAHMYFLEKTRCKVQDFKDGNWWVKGCAHPHEHICDEHICAGYAVPKSEEDNVRCALRHIGFAVVRSIEVDDIVVVVYSCGSLTITQNCAYNRRC